MFPLRSGCCSFGELHRAWVRYHWSLFKSQPNGKVLTYSRDTLALFYCRSPIRCVHELHVHFYGVHVSPPPSCVLPSPATTAAPYRGSQRVQQSLMEKLDVGERHPLRAVGVVIPTWFRANSTLERYKLLRVALRRTGTCGGRGTLESVKGEKYVEEVELECMHKSPLRLPVVVRGNSTPRVIVGWNKKPNF